MYFYENFNWSYLHMCVCTYIYIIHIYTDIHLCPNFPQRYGNFGIDPHWWMRHIFSIPVSLSPCPTSPLLRHPLLPSPSPHRGDCFGAVGKVALQHSFQHSLDWMYCSLLELFLLWSVSVPERRNKGLEFTECLFLKSLYAFPTFFFFKEKKAPFFLVVDK